MRPLAARAILPGMDTPRRYSEDRGRTTELALLIDDMSCGHCKAALRDAVGDVPGVSDVHVDLSAAVVVVRGEGVDAGAVREAIAGAGFRATG